MWVPRPLSGERAGGWVAFENDTLVYDDGIFRDVSSCRSYCAALENRHVGPVPYSRSDFDLPPLDSSFPWHVFVDRNVNGERVYRLHNLDTAEEFDQDMYDAGNARMTARGMNDALQAAREEELGHTQGGVVTLSAPPPEGAEVRIDGVVVRPGPTMTTLRVPPSPEEGDDPGRPVPMHGSGGGDGPALQVTPDDGASFEGDEDYRPEFLSQGEIDVDGLNLSLFENPRRSSSTHYVSHVDGSRFMGMRRGDLVRVFGRAWEITRRAATRAYLRPVVLDPENPVRCTAQFLNTESAVFAREDLLLLNYPAWTAVDMGPTPSMFDEESVGHTLIIGGMSFVVESLISPVGVQLRWLDEPEEESQSEGEMLVINAVDCLSMNHEVSVQVSPPQAFGGRPSTGRLREEEITFSLAPRQMQSVVVGEFIQVVSSGQNRTCIVTDMSVEMGEHGEVCTVTATVVNEGEQFPPAFPPSPGRDPGIVYINCMWRGVNGRYEMHQDMSAGSQHYRIHVNLSIPAAMVEEFGINSSSVISLEGSDIPSALFGVRMSLRHPSDRSTQAQWHDLELFSCSDIFEPGVNLTLGHVIGQVAGQWRVRAGDPEHMTGGFEGGDLPFVPQEQRSRARAEQKLPGEIRWNMVAAVSFRDDKDCYEAGDVRLLDNGGLDEFDIDCLSIGEFVEIDKIIYTVRQVRDREGYPEILIEIASETKTPLGHSLFALSISRHNAAVMGGDAHYNGWYVMMGTHLFAGPFRSAGAARTALVTLRTVGLTDEFEQGEWGQKLTGGRALDMRTDETKDKDARIEALEQAGRDICAKFDMIIEDPSRKRSGWEINGQVIAGDLAAAEALFWAGYAGYEPAVEAQQAFKEQEARWRAIELGPNIPLTKSQRRKEQRRSLRGAAK